ncbi:MAG: PTS mannitol transporter subunit IICBA [Propionibacteriaceae bacterium]|nr:PTS mannitol transporter subunit IICBA [Propionibacteriaceae bacterium]
MTENVATVAKSHAGAREYVQRAGRFLSGMVMPNIGAFIAWGLITALFLMPPVNEDGSFGLGGGWIPNEHLSGLIGPMINYLLPLLIGFTGGKMVGGVRGGVTGAIATAGILVGAANPMFLGAMIAGPVGGLAIKWFDRGLAGKVKAGLEMLVDNFSVGIIGGLLAIFFFWVIQPIVVAVTNGLGSGADFLAKHNLLPLLSVVVEPGKVLFLNNAINHGVFTPLGIEQVADAGKSIFFMVESNPGPGLGLLVAYWIAGKGMAKASAPGAIIVQFLGGIHEIYFPYVLMNPILIIATICGNATGIITLLLLKGGLVGPASPGSIFAEMLMTPRGAYFANITAILLAAVVSCLLSVLLLKLVPARGDGGDLGEAQAKTSAMKSASKGLDAVTSPATVAAAVVTGVDLATVAKIAFACDAGMGSSAMGATVLRKKIKAGGLEGIEVVHCAVGEIPPDVQIVVTHKELEWRAEHAAPQARIVPITNFMAAPQYDELIDELAAARPRTGA